jgi:hypothetical protein
MMTALHVTQMLGRSAATQAVLVLRLQNPLDCESVALALR